MQCANHPDAAAAAYCSNCGKALCSDCFSPDKSPVLCAECEQEREARQASAPPPIPPPVNPLLEEGIPFPLYRRPSAIPTARRVSLCCWASSREWVRFAMETTSKLSAGPGFWEPGFSVKFE